MLERRELRGGVLVLASAPMEEAGFLVAFTERGGGVSSAPYASLNLGMRSADDAGNVLENRRRVCAALDLPPFAAARQVHGTAIATVERNRAGAGFEGPDDAIPGADALVTGEPNVPLAVLTADCVPIALADPRAGLLAVVHAGWRGTAAGIVGAALARFPDPSRILAAVGPSIGLDHYEVSEEVARSISAVTSNGAVVERAAGARLDLPGTIARILEEHGVGNVERAAECTACEERRFFSFRRDGETGRQALIAARLH